VRTLQEIKKLDESVPLALLVEKEGEAPENLFPLGFMPAVYSPNYRLVDEKLVAYCHKRNMQIIPWTVNTRAEMKQLMDMGVDGIITDFPDSLVMLMQL
jgi:glycerophosphoryl diester phosphodiesterase